MNEILARCECAPWSQAHAREWHAEALNAVDDTETPTGTSESDQALAVDLGERVDSEQETA